MSVAFLVAATAGLAQHVTPQLRRADLLRQAAEDELEARRRRFEALLEYSPGGLAVTDHTLTIVDVGVQNERVTGTSPEDRIGRSVLDLVIPEDRRVIVAAYRQVMAEPATPVHFEVSAIPPAGDIRRVSVWLRNLLEDPDIQGLVFNFQDVTAERTARAELTLVRDRLQASHQSTFGLSDARPGDDSLTGESEICADVILEDTPSAHASLE